MSRSTSPSSLPPPVALLRFGSSPSPSPSRGYLDLRGCRIHPQLMLSAPGPGSSLLHGWWRYNFVPIAPRSILHTQSHHSSHITPHSLSGQVSEAAPSRPTGSLSPAIVSGWLLQPQRLWHQNGGSTTHAGCGLGQPVDLPGLQFLMCKIEQ